MACTLEHCVLEKLPQDSRSIGPIQNTELLCRAAWSPNSYRKNGNVRASLIPNSQLAKGQISVWRAAEANRGNVADLADKLKPPEANSFKEFFVTTAEEVRSIQNVEPFERRFCVLDECATDDHGGFDPLHAHITFCRDHDLTKADPDSAAFQGLKTQLLQTFIKGDRWS